MGFKRLIKKGLLGGAGNMIEGHIFDAIQKKKEDSEKEERDENDTSEK